MIVLKIQLIELDDKEKTIVLDLRVVLVKKAHKNEKRNARRNEKKNDIRGNREAGSKDKRIRSYIFFYPMIVKVE